MPYPGGRKQITAVFLSIKREKGLAAAKRWYRKAQREGYAPTAKDDKRGVAGQARQRRSKGS